MPRDFDQIMRSRETDSWKRQWHGSLGTFIGTTIYVGTVSAMGTVYSSGTASLSVSPTTGRDIQFATGLSFSSNLANCRVDLLNGIAFLYSIKLPIVDKFVDNFETPLKTSEGTALNIYLYNIWGTAFLNLSGYLVK